MCNKLSGIVDTVMFENFVFRSIAALFLFSRGLR